MIFGKMARALAAVRSDRMKHKQWWISLVVFIILCLLIEGIGRYWTHETVSTWYPKLVKPSWTPPDYVFGPVWLVLYLMIAVSGWLLYKAEKISCAIGCLKTFCCSAWVEFHLVFSFLLTSKPILGLIDITLLNVFIILTIIKSWRVSRTASILLIPYLVW